MTNATHLFGSSNGSANFYQNTFSPILYTDGVKELAESCGAYWLIDLIISHQLKRKVRIQRFQVWELKRKQDNVFCITATDGNQRQIAKQEIPFSDFKYDMAVLWLVNGCLLLPQEY